MDDDCCLLEFKILWSVYKCPEKSLGMSQSLHIVGVIPHRSISFQVAINYSNWPRLLFFLGVKTGQANDAYTWDLSLKRKEVSL